MDIIESSITPPGVPTRRIVLELPDDRAAALADCLANAIVWRGTPVDHELSVLHEALGGWRD